MLFVYFGKYENAIIALGFWWYTSRSVGLVSFKKCEQARFLGLVKLQQVLHKKGCRVTFLQKV